MEEKWGGGIYNVTELSCVDRKKDGYQVSKANLGKTTSR